jgi:hypothetical protein
MEVTHANHPCGLPPVQDVQGNTELN